MHSASVHPHRSLLRNTIKVTLLLLASAGLLAYAFTHLTSAQWLLLGMLVVAALAVTTRFSSLGQHQSSKVNPNLIIYTDGGTSRRHEVKPVSHSRPVVNDGGSFERARKS